MGGQKRHPAMRTPAPGVTFHGQNPPSVALGGADGMAQLLEQPHISQVPDFEKFRQTYSGVDYHITAVIPRENDYDMTIQDRTDTLSTLIGARNRLLNDLNFPSQPLTKEEREQKIAGIGQLNARINEEEARPYENVSHKTFAEIQTLSITTRRSVHPVRRMGEKFPAYYTRGPRTIAGSLVFIMLEGDPMLDLFRRTEHDDFDGEPAFLADRMPPFNILITGINEGGHMVQGALFDVTLLAMGITLSVDDMYTEQQFTYVARWMLPMVPIERYRSVLERYQHAHPLGAGPASMLEHGLAAPGLSEAVRRRQQQGSSNRLGVTRDSLTGGQKVSVFG